MPNACSGKAASRVSHHQPIESGVISSQPRAYAADRVLIVGAGSWGTALAVQIARNQRSVVLWGHRAEHIEALRQERRNRRYLPECAFPERLSLSADLKDALRSVRDLILAVPSDGLRDTLQAIRGCEADVRVAWACKGIEAGTHLFPHQVVEQVLAPGRPMAVISGPTFAAEVAAGLPAALAVAANDPGFASDLAKRLHGGRLRAYTNDDIIGVEVGGAVKNVLAIAAGIADGLGFGANTRAALITRGLAEMTRLGVQLGGRSETFIGLAGLGDLVLTCTDNQSRNRRLGLALAQGLSAEEGVRRIGQVVEGLRTAFEVDYLAHKHSMEMPIVAQVAQVLNGQCTPREAVQALLARAPKQELS
ncbi:MAG: NAD(P)H-dependent glycerol-3-phosphate dehydrogenase [Gammaproteobacteria bacterium]